MTNSHERLIDHFYGHLISGGVIMLEEREHLTADGRAALVAAGEQLMEDRAQMIGLQVALAVLNPQAAISFADGCEVEDFIVRKGLEKAVAKVVAA